MLDIKHGTTCPSCYRTVTFYKLTKRKAYACGKCRAHIYPLAGTIFHKSRTSLWLWFYSLYLFSVSKNGVSAAELQRTIGVTYKSAWRMANQIRSLMRTDDKILDGVIESDEAYIGHKDTKVMISGIVKRGGTAKVRITRSRDNTAEKLIQQSVTKNSKLITDGGGSFISLYKYHDHTIIPHVPLPYISGELHTNTIEGMWSLLKGNLLGTYRTVSNKYLQYYINEFTFHYNRNHSVIFQDLLDRCSEESYDKLVSFLLYSIYLCYRPYQKIQKYNNYAWPYTVVALVVAILSPKQPEASTWLDEASNELENISGIYRPQIDGEWPEFLL